MKPPFRNARDFSVLLRWAPGRIALARVSYALVPALLALAAGCPAAKEGVLCADDSSCAAGYICANTVCVPGCRTDADCDSAGGEVCRSLKCGVPCDSDADCTGRNFCSSDDICELGYSCSDDPDCGPKMFCNARGGACAPVECDSDDACGTGRICEDRRCYPAQCADHFDCGGELCLSGRCRPCADHADCADFGADAVCCDGACAEPCAQGADCAGLLCAGNGCCVSCALGFACGAGESCCGDECRPTCQSDGDCPAGSLCNDGCCETCAEGAPCPVGRVCCDGMCTRLQCVADVNCLDGQVCCGGCCAEVCDDEPDPQFAVASPPAAAACGEASAPQCAGDCPGGSRCVSAELDVACFCAPFVYASDPAPSLELGSTLAGDSSSVVLSFSVTPGELETYRFEVALPAEFAAQGFRDPLRPNAPVGTFGLDLDFDGLDDVEFPLVTLDRETTYVDMNGNNAFDAAFEASILHSSDSHRFTGVLPFGGDADETTTEASFAAQANLRLARGAVANPLASGDFLITGCLTSVDPDTDGHDDGENHPPITACFEQVVSIGGVIQVTIDIRPRTYPNRINLRSRALVPVAILTTPDFDALTIDPATIELAGAGVAVRKKGHQPFAADKHASAKVAVSIRGQQLLAADKAASGKEAARKRDHQLFAAERDIDRDGDRDLLVWVRSEELELDVDSTEAELVGRTFDGADIVGVDSVRIIQPNVCHRRHTHVTKSGTPCAAERQK